MLNQVFGDLIYYSLSILFSDEGSEGGLYAILFAACLKCCSLDRWVSFA
jgi:hypothetical protein